MLRHADRLLLLAAAVLLATADAAAARCGDRPGESDALAEARAQVDSVCGCAGTRSHREFTACALRVARERVTAGTLPKRCRGAVKRCAAKSTCGRPNAVTCCITRKGRTRCRVKKSAARCLAKGGCVGSWASCCDACTATGCRPPATTSTTSTTTASTSSSTTTTESTTTTVVTTSSTTTTTLVDGQPCVGTDAEPIECGTAVSCLLDPPGDTDSFTFDVPEGGAVVISVHGTHQPCWQLFDPLGGNIGTPRCDTADNIGPLGAGTHTIVVTELGSQDSDYVLSLQGVSEPYHCGRPLSLPTDLEIDALSPAGDTDAYSFDAQAGQVVNISVSGDKVPCWRIFAPNGDAIKERCDDVGQAGPLEAGVHTIVVRELTEQETNYALSVQLVSGQ